MSDANKQIKKSGYGERGAAELQLTGEAAQTANLADINRGVRSNFNQNRGSSLNRVFVYRDGELIGEWVRNADGSVTQSHP